MTQAVLTNRRLQHKIFLKKVFYSALEFVFGSDVKFQRRLGTNYCGEY